MKINACSVAFRHMPDLTAAALAHYTTCHGFDGIEIWAPHATAMADAWAALPHRPDVAMLAGYLPLGLPGFDRAGAQALVDLTRRWHAPQLRLFAGGVGHADATDTHRRAILTDLRIVADLAGAAGLRVAVETHPGTLADTVAATRDLLDRLSHPAVGVNFDVLHVWESGADPVAAQAMLAPHILHYHLKNVTHRDRLPVFHPGNVHDAHGDRDGMCPLFQGTIDYRPVLTALPAHAGASLEWFGPAPGATMAADLRAARATLSALAA